MAVTKKKPVKQTTAAQARAEAAAAWKNYQALANQTRAPGMGADMKAVGALYPDYSGNVLSDIQLRKNAQQNVLGILGPQIQQIQGLYAQRGTAGTNAIGQLTNAYTGRMQDWSQDVAARNQASLAQMAGLEAGLANFTRDRNASLQGDLTGALQGMNAGGGLMAEAAGNNAALGNTAAVNTAALGTSSLQRMGTEAMAANSYAGMQPGFAAQEGQQQMGMFQSGLNQAMQSDVGDIRAKMPELIYQVYNNLLDNNNTQRQMKAQRGQSMTSAWGDAQDRALTSQSSSLQAAQGLAQLKAQQYADTLEAQPSNEVTDPREVIAGVYNEIFPRFASNPKFMDLAGNTKGTWAWYHPKMALKQIETALRTRSAGKVPAGVIRQQAQEMMRELGLRLTVQGGGPQQAGGAPIVGNAGDGSDLGWLANGARDNPLLAAGFIPGPVGLAGHAATMYDGGKRLYNSIFGG